jgi:two-component system NarL family sensor kinase
MFSCRELERLASIEHRALRNYFRLLEANRELRARASGTPKTMGAILADSMEAERQRLGRELHTGVGQALAGIHVHVSLLEAALPDPPEPVRKSLDRISALAGTALEQVRGVSRRLYVPAWQAQPLVEALRNLWEASGISGKFAGTLDLRELSAEPPPEVRRTIYLVAQEGISNAIQHADARSVRMSLGEEGGRITLEVADDGSGFPPPADPDQPAASEGIGLRSMRDLARHLGGDLQAQSTPEGAQLTISFPVIHE